MNSLKDFERISIINLVHRADRRLEMAEQLANVGLSFESPNVRLFKAVRPSEAGGFDSIGARGCFMSHLEVLREARSLSNILILEDDLDFVPGAEFKLYNALRVLPPDWGMFYGGCLADLPQDGNAIALVAAKSSLQNAHFVAFNGHIIANLVDYLEAILRRPPGHIDGGPMHVDGAYSRFRAENPEIAVYAATPELGYQRSSRTDIHKLKWFDRIPIVKDAVQMIRRRRVIRRRRSMNNI